MKRNTLMKRLAVAALAATMTVGMAVPTFAAKGTTNGTAAGGTGPYHTTTAPQYVFPEDETDKVEWYALNSWDHTVKVQLNSAADDLSADFHIENGELGHYVKQPDEVEYVYVGGQTGSTTVTQYTQTQYDSWKSATKDADYIKLDNGNYVKKVDVRYAAKTDGLTEGTDGIITDEDEYDDVNTSWKSRFATVTTTDIYSFVPFGDKLDRKFVTVPDGTADWKIHETTDDGYTVEWSIKAENDNYFSADFDKDDSNLIEFTPEEFGTTIYKYTGKLYHNGKYAGSGDDGDATGYFAITMPLNKDTIKELVDDGAEEVVSTNGVNTAANDAETAIKEAINAKNPKIWVYGKKENNDYTVDVDVTSVTDFHADDGFKGHVVVTVKDADGKEEAEYEYGTLNFKFAKAALNFTDVAEGKYFYDPVYWAVKEGVTKGTSDTEFSPYNEMTRKDFVVMLYRKEGSPAVNINNKFDDIAGLSTEAQKAISWAVKEGIVDGASEVKFNPNGAINRAQAVTMLYRLEDPKGDYNETNFTDVPHDAYYEDAVDWAANAKVVNGTSDTTFSPYTTLNRAQAVTFLYRYYTIVNK